MTIKIFGRRHLAPALLLALAPATAHAGDVPLYQPVPDWVVPVPAQAATTGPLSLRILDLQNRIDHGTVVSYADTAIKIDSPDALTRAGTLAIPWAPDHGDLIIHAVTILRDGQAIDVLAAGGKFTVLRREGQLEALSMTGIRTATMPVEGLRVGDVLETRYSITQHDPVMAGHANIISPVLPLPVRIGFGRARTIWADGDAVAWRTYLDGVTPATANVGGWHELTVTMPAPKQPDEPKQAPARFIHVPAIEFSDFADWPDVSRTFAPLYRTDTATAAIAPGGDLDKEVAKIAAATTDPRTRTAMALQLVQDKVRYFFVGMDGGNYVPQTPEQTWAKRYGDCKAKTMLLLAVLHRLGVSAEPALANLGAGDIVHSRLPSAEAFNHVFVIAHVAGKDVWLEGTALGTRLADLDDVAAYHWVLPLRSEGAQLIEAPTRAPARPDSKTLAEIDMRGGMGLAAPIHQQVVMRGGMASQINSAAANLEGEARADMLRGFLNTPEGSITLAPQFAYDPATDEVTITADGLVANRWTRADSRYTYDSGLFGVETYPERSRSIWKDVPVVLGAANNMVNTLRVTLPRGGAGITMVGDANQKLVQPGVGVDLTTASLVNGLWQLELTYTHDGGEIPVNAIPQYRRQDSDYFDHAPKLRSVPDYPAPWRAIAEGKRQHLYDRALAILGQYISEKPEDSARYLARARYYGQIFEWQAAIADVTKAIALNADQADYEWRAEYYEAMGDDKAALADAQASLDLVPSDLDAINRLVRLQAMTGAKDDALSRLDSAIDAGGDNVANYLEAKANVLALTGNRDDALAAIDAAVAKKSGNAGLLNARCWLKGELNVDLDAAIADCSRAISLDDAVAPAAMDSRALAYFRQGKLKEARADLDSVLDRTPEQAGSFFMRALVRRATGDNAGAKDDLAAARLIRPSIDEEYVRFGLK